MTKDSRPPHRIELEGEYDLTRKDEITQLFGGVDGAPEVIIDLSRVTYMDSTVLGALALLRIYPARSVNMVVP